MSYNLLTPEANRKNMTYKDLLNQLQQLSEKDLAMDVMIFDDQAGEWHTVDDNRIVFADESDNLPYGNPYIFLGDPAPNFY